ncbi:hypothetical protein J6590_085323 [Homalodisca vitripennis]|nr:hypothetical protein J6590_085323 [Homalodisca vitripennis]
MKLPVAKYGTNCRRRRRIAATDPPCVTWNLTHCSTTSSLLYLVSPCALALHMPRLYAGILSDMKTGFSN